MPVAGNSKIRSRNVDNWIISLAHLDKWTQPVGQYGQKLVQPVPEQIRPDLLAIIPNELENELDQPSTAHVKTYTWIIDWCKSGNTKSRQKVLAAQQLKQV